MNLLKDNFISARNTSTGTHEWVGLKHLICSSEDYDFVYPRDDFELGVLCLCISIVQCLWMPNDLTALKTRLKTRLSSDEYDEKIHKYAQWFELDSEKNPFMQIRKVNATDITPMDKLMPGLTGGTNCAFVNEPGLANALCSGCTAIALFNYASSAPGFGGGFKSGLRGSAPITTLVQGSTVYQTIWLNIMTGEYANDFYLNAEQNQVPTWVDPIEEKETIQAMKIGLLRGLFWQPAHIELCPPVKTGRCDCCGLNNTMVYTGFKKEKFNFTIVGLWPHPHSTRLLKLTNDKIEEKYASFTTTAPSWTRLTRLVVEQGVHKGQKEGQIIAPVIQQAKALLAGHSNLIHLLVGGYRNNQASILERRHEILSFTSFDAQLISEIVSSGLEYKSALRGALYVFTQGMKDTNKKVSVKGSGTLLHELCDGLFYQRTQYLVENALSSISRTNIEQLDRFKHELRKKGESIFKELTDPFLHDPQLIHTLAVARRTWLKKVNLIS